MKYRNTKTGAIIDSPFKISGGDWAVEGEPIQEKKGFDKYTKAELYKMLEEQDIDYSSSQTKKELIALLEGD